MPPLVRLMSLLRFVPPHRVVVGRYSTRPPSALCLMGSASTVFRYVTLYRPPHAAGAVFHQPASAQAIFPSGSPLPAWPTKGGAMWPEPSL